MTPEQIEQAYITIPEIMADAGAANITVHNWLKYHRYMEFEDVLGRPVVRREEYARFKREYPELVQPQKPVAA